MINIKIEASDLLPLCKSGKSTENDSRLSSSFEQLLQKGLDSYLEIPQIVQALEMRTEEDNEESSSELVANELAHLLLGIDLRVPQEHSENGEISKTIPERIDVNNKNLLGQAPLVTDTDQNSNHDLVLNRPEVFTLANETINSEIKLEQTLLGSQGHTAFSAEVDDNDEPIIEGQRADNVLFRKHQTQANKASNLNQSFTIIGETNIQGLELMQNSKLISNGRDELGLFNQDPSLGMVVKNQSLRTGVNSDSNPDTVALDSQLTELLETLEPQVKILDTDFQSRISESVTNQVLNKSNLKIEHGERLVGYVPQDTITSELAHGQNDNDLTITSFVPEQEIHNLKTTEPAEFSEVFTDPSSQSLVKSIPEVEVETVSSESSIPQFEFQDEVVEQIVDRMAFNIDQEHQEVRIQLKPDYLGEVSIKLAIERGIVRAEFVAENQVVREIIATSLPQLRSNMEQAGIHLGDVNINLGNQQDSNESGDRRQQFSNKLAKKPEAAKFMEEPNLSDGYSQINLRA